MQVDCGPVNIPRCECDCPEAYSPRVEWLLIGILSTLLVLPVWQTRAADLLFYPCGARSRRDKAEKPELRPPAALAPPAVRRPLVPIAGTSTPLSTRTLDNQVWTPSRLRAHGKDVARHP